jgi:OOP family OmpA-OmpF porin
MKKLIALIALPLAASVSTVTMADDKAGVYVGGGIGYGQSTLNLKVEGNKGQVKTKDMRFNLHTGYRVNEYFAVEAGYYDLGNIKKDDFFNIKSQAYGLSAVGFIPLSDKVELYGKAGTAKVTHSEKGHKENDDALFFTTGVNFSVTKDIDLYGEAMHMNTQLHKSAKIDNTTANVGIRFNF